MKFSNLFFLMIKNKLKKMSSTSLPQLFEDLKTHIINTSDVASNYFIWFLRHLSDNNVVFICEGDIKEPPAPFYYRSHDDQLVEFEKLFDQIYFQRLLSSSREFINSFIYELYLVMCAKHYDFSSDNMKTAIDKYVKTKLGLNDIE